MIEVVVAGLGASAPALRAMSAWLSDEERRRASRLRADAHQRRFIVARARLRALLAARLGEPPQTLELVRGRNGKPALGPRHDASGWRFNLSHSEEVALYAFARGREVGVDVEALRPMAEADAIAARFFSARERAVYDAAEAPERPAAFLRCWTRKEALAKALGEGLSMPLEVLDACAAPSGWRVETFHPLPGYIAALAVARA